jgi:benzoyl-CoA reductase/2-hydroxyglutaryl-CoA dehydratase subunit BcrC/BadD/HgdB
MNIPKEILRAAAEPYWAPAEAAKKGRAPVAILPGYFPAELLAAGGGHPFRIWGGRAATVNADADLQPYICSMAKSVLEDILDGTLDFCKAFVVPSVCDTMQNLSDVIAARGKKVFCFRIPRTSFRPDAEAWLVRETARFGEWIKGVTGRALSDEALAMEADRWNGVRSSVLELYGLRRACPPPFSGPLFYDVAFASFSLDPGAFTAALSCCATDFKCLHPSTGSGKRVIVSGTAPIPAAFLQSFVDAGLDVADDDFMAGRRLFSKPILQSFSPAALFESFLGGAPCPSNTFGHDRRPQYLIDLARAADAQGVVFWQTKACENEAFDYPWVAGALKEAGLKVMIVETEQKMRTFETSGQRIAAFAETF